MALSVLPEYFGLRFHCWGYIWARQLGRLSRKRQAKAEVKMPRHGSKLCATPLANARLGQTLRGAGARLWVLAGNKADFKPVWSFGSAEFAFQDG